MKFIHNEPISDTDKIALVIYGSMVYQGLISEVDFYHMMREHKKICSDSDEVLTLTVEVSAYIKENFK